MAAASTRVVIATPAFESIRGELPTCPRVTCTSTTKVAGDHVGARLQGRLDRRQRQGLQHPLRGEVEHPGCPDERDGQQPGRAVVWVQAQDQDRECEVDEAAEVVERHLHRRRDDVRRIGDPLRGARQDGTGDRVHVQCFVHRGSEAGHQRDHPLPEHEQRTEHVPGEQDPPEGVDPADRASWRRPAHGVTRTVPTMGGWIRHA